MGREERKVTMKGKPLTLAGNEVRVGEKAPDFTVVDNDLNEVTWSKKYKGRVCIIASVPSLDTSVCDRETRTFNEKATALSDDVLVLTISMDLPFAQKRWCAAAGVERVITLSDHRDASFGRKYGVLMEELRLLARAVFVVDANGVIRYRQIVDELGDEPDYETALEAVRRYS